MSTRPTAATRADADAEVRPVPVYVRATDDGWELVESSTNTAIESYASVRDALDAALGIDEIGGALKTPVLRTDGEPDGEWRWLDASAEEAEPLGGVRITPESLWTMAAGLNAAPKPVAIDGGAVDGLAPSEVHGTALDSGTLANGWAHVGIVVLDADEQTHLYLRTELLPEVAAEVDRGRLAYGSIHFRHAGTEDDGAPINPELASHALTNDPAVQNLTPASGVRECVRTRRMQMADTTDTTRGAAMDLLKQAATLFGADVSEMSEEQLWELSDKLRALFSAAQVEEMVEAGAPAPAAQPAAEVAASTDPAAPTETRAEGDGEGDMLEGEELTAWADAMLALAREVVGKADATHQDALDLLTAGKEALTAAMMPAAPPAEGEGGEASAEAAAEAGRSAASSEANDIALRASNDSMRAELTALRAEKTRRETADWLDEQIRTRKLPMPADRRERLIAIAVQNGRPVVEEALDLAHRPPTGEVMRSAPSGSRAGAGSADTQLDVIERIEVEIRSECVARGKKLPPGHILHAQARRRAEKAHPGLFTSTETPGAPSALTGA